MGLATLNSAHNSKWAPPTPQIGKLSRSCEFCGRSVPGKSKRVGRGVAARGARWEWVFRAGSPNDIEHSPRVRMLPPQRTECVALQDLDLTSCVTLSADAIQRQLAICSTLQTLQLCGCRRLKLLRLSSPSLVVLHVCWCSQLSKLELYCPQLRRLFAHGCGRLAKPSLCCSNLLLLEVHNILCEIL